MGKTSMGKAGPVATKKQQDEHPGFVRDLNGGLIPRFPNPSFYETTRVEVPNEDGTTRVVDHHLVDEIIGPHEEGFLSGSRMDP